MSHRTVTAGSLRTIRAVALAAVAVALLAGTVPAAAGQDHAFLGISSRGLKGEEARDMRLETRDGAIIQKVYTGTAASEAGLERGDVILEFGGEKVFDDSDLTDMIRSHDPGEAVSIGIVRDGQPMTLEAELGSRDDWSDHHDDDRPGWVQALESIFGDSGPDGPYLGVEVMELNKQMAKSFDVEDEGGVMITRVLRNSAAEAAGIQAGDIVVRIAGERTPEHGDIRDALDGRFGETIQVDIVRRGSRKSLDVTLEED